MMKKWSRVQKHKAIFILALSIVFTNTLITYDSTIKLIDNRESVTYSHKFITQLQIIQSTLQDAETAQRNYLITSDIEALTAYYRGYKDSDRHLHNLNQLIANHPQQQQWFNLLNSKISSKFNTLQQEIYLRKNQGLAATKQIILSKQDKQIGKEIQQLISEYLKTEENLLQREIRESQAISQKAVMRFLMTLILHLLLVALLYKLLCNYVKQLQQAEEKICEQKLLLDVVKDAIIVQNIHNQILFWNQGAQSLYGWKVEEAVGKNVEQLLYQGTSPQFEDAYLSVINTGEWRGELYQLTKEGKEIIVESRWILLQHDNGQLKSILSVNTEITQHKQLEAQLLRSQRLESIGTLTSGIVHDLNNLLSPILMSVQLLQKKFPDTQSQKVLQTLENNVKRSANLLKQILTFARGIENKRTIIEILPLITEIQEIIAQTFPDSIICQIDIPKNLWYLRGDATQLHQVLMNLAVNARDAMPDGGILKIVAENVVIGEHSAQININAKVGSYIAIVVTDTGMGMSSEVQQRIFEPFFTTKDVSKGTGLGLSTALDIIKNHGGFVNLYTQVGRGTQFTVYLPALTSTQTPSVSQKLESVTGDG
ncbi:histidine kinase [Nostoc linckia z18]|uniref:histidine kinase n=3 Tax=Nostoc linckia TaxID=92942 RepID=A0A9Q5ZDV3_NOSLI|nr:CHASE3 domain-containing protein [Nostoc linckia]PHJ61562.1 histidine kinase [Nostoc linckia z1]PHK05001.1 histidine kinase [Nostoc linckia z8]PHK21735.1 histidine kinase [Nostoc linckia z14]PHK35653.1 histidine kinase [Nostoc linckia z18]PHK40075.1 histidine kinase [Nostoc linckia z15]PHK47009.1 histidine kinase [Nostoc linckia z16]